MILKKQKIFTVIIKKKNFGLHVQTVHGFLDAKSGLHSIFINFTKVKIEINLLL